MSLQLPRVFPATITTGNSLSAGINLGGGYLYLSLEIPTNTNAFPTSGGSPVWIQGSNDGINYRRMYEIYTNSVANAFSIQSSVSNALVPITYFNFQYAKLEVSGTVTGGGGAVGYKLVATDSL